MTDFIETVSWDSPDDLRNNIRYGLERPTLSNILHQREGLTVGGTGIFGKGIYRYDYGRLGRSVEFRFIGSGRLKFRVKTANSVSDLESAEYEGTDVDRFSGSVIDAVKYTVVPNAYSVAQSNGIYLTGSQSSSAGVFENPAQLRLNTPMLDTYSVRTSMRLLVDTNYVLDSGSFSFLGLDTVTDSIQVQKYYAQIRPSIVDAYGNSLGRDIDSNDIILGEPVDIEIDGVFSETVDILTDGVFGNIVDEISAPVVEDEFDDLKMVDNVVDFIERTSLDHNCVRVLGIRADYSLTGILADSKEGLYYRPKRTNGYYAMRIPLVEPKVDLFSSNMQSHNKNSEFVYAEVDDHWTTTMLVPAGVHRYYFLVDGERELDALNPEIITTASGDMSAITVESTQFVQFEYSGKASTVHLVGTFNDFKETANPLTVGHDASEVLKVVFDGETYHNNNEDWHKIEVEFECPTPVIGIRFLTDVPLDQKQRIRILLDDAPLTRDEWELRCALESVEEPGVSECATYSNLLASTFEPECLSYFDNNTDVITASEDGWVEWHFKLDDPINDRQILSYRKLAFWSRLENYSIYQRSHRGLELLVPDDFVAKVTDFLVSDNEWPFRHDRRTLTSLAGTWNIPQLVLQEGENVLDPSEILGEAHTYGDSVSIIRDALKSFIEPFNKSGIALNNTEVACTLATNLTEEMTEVTIVEDLGSAGGGPPPPEPRFTRESFTRSTDHLRVVVISIDIEPVGAYYLHLVGDVGKFVVEVYATEEDARNRTNRLGYAESTGYGYQVITNYTVDNPLLTPTGLVDVEAENIIVCFDEYAADTIFITRPRANV